MNRRLQIDVKVLYKVAKFNSVHVEEVGLKGQA